MTKVSLKFAELANTGLAGVRKAGGACAAVGVAIIASVIGTLSDIEKGSQLADVAHGMYPHLENAVFFGITAYCVAAIVEKSDKELDELPLESASSHWVFVLFALLPLGVLIASAERLMRASVEVSTFLTLANMN